MVDIQRRAVVITGASSGIGEGFAHEFARRGNDLVLVARRAAALETIARTLRNAHDVHIDVIACDLSDLDAAANLPTALLERGVTASGLINSAGFGTAGEFIAEDPNRITSEILLNVGALTLLTRLLLPQLVATRGVIVQVSSNASHQPLPGMAVYAATKAYVTSFTEALWREMKGSGVRVLALCPGPTATEFFAVAGSETFKVGAVAEVKNVIDGAFRHLARSQAGPVLTVGKRNQLQGVLSRTSPRRLRLAVAARLVAEAS
ncbi:hypothetical protein FHX48_001374 [Microbacterium halimionae]|uniref:Oxidoreductase n=1 Tax=Microbacterium halimionae TaxID=1526413 RepID=A0A7W3JNZ7_9MICO|nr:SDR family NAD(P)-dependent oxidoreductase [Microbacterium halimionae]MBA8816301.1 hypothetical protein [Microbacterium halimionae]NII96504.1 hypothetical protein [Microbacterium halimionae]